MGLADALTRLTVELTVHEDGELVQVQASLDHPDWMEIDEDEDSELYRCSCVLSVPLVNGELRTAMREGSHDDANLCDNTPWATVSVPLAQLPSPLRARVRGEIIFESGPRVAWDQELTPDDGVVPLVHTATGPTVERSTARPGIAVRHSLPSPPPDAHVVACLPERGLVTWSRTGYSLITPAGVCALPTLDALVATFGTYDGRPRTHRGGARGRLAIGITRNDGEHLLVVEIDGTDVRQLHRSKDIRLTRGGFDATGSLLIVLTGARERIDETTEVFRSWLHVLDCDRGELLPWRGDGSPGLRGRCEIDGDVMFSTGEYGRLEVVPRSGPAVTTKIDVAVGSYPASAWNPAANVAAWADDHNRELPCALHCYHPTWGIRPIPLPSRGEPIAVLRDGRVVVDADHLLIVDPASNDIADLGPTDGYLGELPQLVENGERATLWTLIPSSWRIDLPSR